MGNFFRADPSKRLQDTTVRYVALDGSGDFEDLQEAQNFAFETNAISPGTIKEIIVRPGVYFVDNSGTGPHPHPWLACYVKMTSSGGSGVTSIVTSDAANATLSVTGVFFSFIDERGISADDSSIQGFTFSNFTGVGGPDFQFFDFGPGEKMHRDIIMGQGNGMWLADGNQTTVEDCTIRNAPFTAGRGILVGFDVDNNPTTVIIRDTRIVHGATPVQVDFIGSGFVGNLTCISLKQVGTTTPNGIIVSFNFITNVLTRNCEFECDTIAFQFHGGSSGIWTSIDDVIRNNNAAIENIGSSVIDIQGTTCNPDSFIKGTGSIDGFGRTTGGVLFGTKDVNAFSNIPLLEYGLLGD